MILRIGWLLPKAAPVPLQPHHAGPHCCIAAEVHCGRGQIHERTMSVLRGQCCIKCNLVTAICVKIYIMWGTVLRSSVCGAPVLAMSAPDAVPLQGTGRDPRPKPHNDDYRIGLNTARVHICRPIHNTSASCHELVATRYPEQVDGPARRVPDAGIPHCTIDNMQPAIHTLCTAMSTPWVSPYA